MFYPMGRDFSLKEKKNMHLLCMCAISRVEIHSFNNDKYFAKQWKFSLTALRQPRMRRKRRRKKSTAQNSTDRLFFVVTFVYLFVCLPFLLVEMKDRSMSEIFIEINFFLFLHAYWPIIMPASGKNWKWQQVYL